MVFLGLAEHVVGQRNYRARSLYNKTIKVLLMLGVKITSETNQQSEETRLEIFEQNAIVFQ